MPEAGDEIRDSRCGMPFRRQSALKGQNIIARGNALEYGISINYLVP
jgi:hypothetical protein